MKEFTVVPQINTETSGDSKPFGFLELSQINIVVCIHEGEKLTSASLCISVWFSRLQQDSVCFLS